MKGIDIKINEILENQDKIKASNKEMIDELKAYFKDFEFPDSWYFADFPINNVFVYGEKDCFTSKGGKGVGVNYKNSLKIIGEFKKGL